MDRMLAWIALGHPAIARRLQGLEWSESHTSEWLGGHMSFEPVGAAQSVPVDPVALFDEIPRVPGAIPELWRSQADLLRGYASSFTGSDDVAFELPTGTGKTMVGLLVASWRRAKFGKPVVYACPTKQLVHQVADVAVRERIPAVTLIDSSKTWSHGDLTRYESAEAIAVTTYSHVFNTSPKLGSYGTVLFDDAHAAEQFVAESWTVDLGRHRQEGSYLALLDVLKSGLDGTFHQRLLSTSPDIATKKDVRLIVPSRYPNMVTQLDAAMAAFLEASDEWWRAQAVRSGLSSSLVYVSWGRIQIRPFVPPTSECGSFAQADQRLYLSATLGHAGELNRAFGRTDIRRVPLPDDARAPRSGRRFFVFPDLVENDGLAVIQESVKSARKTLVLSTSTEKAVAATQKINIAGSPVYGKDDIATGVQAFANAADALLALAGRYDGIDLPGDVCRMVLMHSLPEIPHLQEQFLARNLRARAALEERTRTRVVQGAGRATRSPSDYAIVMPVGGDLVRYLSNPSNRSALDVDIQAEIEFGRTNSANKTKAFVMDNVELFLDQGDEWHSGAEPHIRAARAAMSRVPNDGEENLASSAPHEVLSCQLAWRGDYVGARDAAQRAAAALSGAETLRTYRSLWLYLAAVWSYSATGQDANATRTARGLLEQAYAAARGTTWIRESDPGDVPDDQQADDTPAVRRIVEIVEGGLKLGKVVARFDAIDERLVAVEHTKSEPAITELGAMLGAEAAKPKGQGRADSIWSWARRVWIAVEAKTEQDPDGEISLGNVRQANTQLRLHADDLGVALPDQVADVIVSPRGRIAQEAIAAADPHVYLAHPDDIRAIAADAREAWTQLMARKGGHEGEDLDVLVRRLFGERRCLPSQILERLTSEPIAG